jgi:nucleoside-diphosphate-sugar epimerase
MLVAVIGATGVVGRNLIPRLLDAGHTVRAGVRRLGAAVRLQGVTEVEADILDPARLGKLVTGSDVVINVASSIPRADGKGGDWKLYDQIRRQGTSNVIRACTEAGVGLVAQSIAMLHCVDQSRPQDEHSPMRATGVREAALDLENLVTAWSGNWRIVRGGNLYGPGTSTDDVWFRQLRQGKLTLPGSGQDWLSCVHVADLAAAFVKVVEDAPPRTGWIAADDQPLRWIDLFKVVAGLADQSPERVLAGGEQVLPGFNVTNARLRGLGWTPRYASVRSGLVATAEYLPP